MKRKFYAQIVYTMKPTHPNYNDLPTGKWFRERYLTHEDEYTFNDIFATTEPMICHIKNDLKLTAGGGYNADHIENVSFMIKEVPYVESSN